MVTARGGEGLVQQIRTLEKTTPPPSTQPQAFAYADIRHATSMQQPSPKLREGEKRKLYPHKEAEILMFSQGHLTCGWGGLVVC